jgi:hypothetical protein
MDANTPSFSNRSNAKRAAEAKLANGTAPAAEYELRTRDDGRAEIVWKTTPVVPARIDGIKGKINCHDTTNSGDARATASTGPGEPAIEADQLAGHAKPAEQSRRRAADDAPSKGVLPQKPVITSKTNQHYQRRFDRLAELAAAGDWDAVRAYEITGSNTYSKMLERYRRQLLATDDGSDIAQ